MCREVLPVEQFYKVSSRQKFSTYCRPCSKVARRRYNQANADKNRAYQRAYDKAHPEWFRATRRAAYHRNPAKALAITARWRARHRERYLLIGRTQERVRQAIKKGLLVRPDRCEQCGQMARIEAAHSDYSRPLDVRWLCALCHRRWDRDEPKTKWIEAA
jgi:hypothetical protein